MPKPKDYYTVLGVEPRSHARIIEATYWARAHELHTLPTRQAQKRLVALNEAYETLASPHRREQYDRQLRQTEAAAARNGSSGGFMQFLTNVLTKPFRPD